MPASDPGMTTQFSPVGELVCLGGSSWLEVALDLTLSYELSSELKRGRMLARG
jgi:hypothetical protein